MLFFISCLNLGDFIAPVLFAFWIMTYEVVDYFFCDVKWLSVRLTLFGTRQYFIYAYQYETGVFCFIDQLCSTIFGEINVY